MESRVLPAARDMNELGLGSDEGLAEPSRSEKTARALQAPELEGDG